MAEFRKVHTKIWEDEWFCELDPDAKLLFIYLITNRAAPVSGIYQRPLKFIAFETGLSRERVEELLGEFQKAGKIEYEDNVIWIKKMRQYQESNSPKIARAIENELADIPDCPIKRRYLEYYSDAQDDGDDMASDDGDITSPDGDTAPLQHAYSIDTVSIESRETETETETERETETETERDLPAPPAPGQPLAAAQTRPRASPKPAQSPEPAPERVQAQEPGPRKRARAAKTAVDPGFQPLFEQLCQTCVMDPKLNASKIGAFARRLRRAGYGANHVADFEAWWYANDWRGQKGQPPTLEQVASMLPQAVNGAHPRASPRAEPKGFAAIREYMRRRGLNGDGTGDPQGDRVLDGSVSELRTEAGDG